MSADGILGRPIAPRGHYLTPEEAERFWAKVNERANGEGCWKWTAGCFANGMGAFQVRGKTEAASHVAWAEAGRTVHHGRRLLSTCGNAWCVNPDHREYAAPKVEPSAPRPQREKRPKLAVVEDEPEQKAEVPAPKQQTPPPTRPAVMHMAVQSFTDTDRVALLSEPITTIVVGPAWSIVYTRTPDIVGYGADLRSACDDALRKRASREVLSA